MFKYDTYNMQDDVSLIVMYTKCRYFKAGNITEASRTI